MQLNGSSRRSVAESYSHSTISKAESLLERISGRTRSEQPRTSSGRDEQLGFGRRGSGYISIISCGKQGEQKKKAGDPQRLTFPLGPRSDRGSMFRLGGRRGRFLGLFLARSLLNRSPSWASRLGRGRGSFRRWLIFGWSGWSSARWPGTAVLAGVGFPLGGKTSGPGQRASMGTYQSGSNSPPGRYLERKVSKAPSSLWHRQNGCNADQ